MGAQKATNYAMKDMSKDEFIKAVTTGLNAPPAYFPLNARINKEGYESMDEVYSKGMQALSVSQFKGKMKEDVWILDTRQSTVFTLGFVPGSFSIGLDGRFAEWAGSLLPLNQALILVTDAGKEKESITRLARVGIDNVQGYLDGGYDAWVAAGEQIDMIIDIEPDEFAMDLPHDDLLEVIDVRKPAEFEAGHVKGAVNVPLDSLKDPVNVAMISDEHNLYVHCAGGYRSVIAASILKHHGYHNLRNVLGGYGKIKEQKGVQLVLPDKVGA
jgi:rhodanese-related sulfurtransferase